MAPPGSYDCPFCDEPFESKEALAGHVVAEHHSLRVGNHSLLVSKLHPSMICWCGRSVSGMNRIDMTEDLVMHWDRSGGLETHILELSLGAIDL